MLKSALRRTEENGKGVVGLEYKELIIEMVSGLKDEKFLRQIYTLIRLHIEKGRD